VSRKQGGVALAFSEEEGIMRILQFFLVLFLAVITFSVSFIGTRLSEHQELASDQTQYGRMINDVVYAVTVALPASLPPMHVALPKLSMSGLASSAYAAFAHRSIPGIGMVYSLHAPSTESIERPEPVPHSEILAGVIASRSKPLFSPKDVLRITTVRANNVMLANISAKRGGTIRFEDGSYFSVAPLFLAHDIGVSVALSAPALPDAKSFDAASEAMVISFKPVVDGLAYAEPASMPMHGATAGIALSTKQWSVSRGHMIMFVKHVYMQDGTSADFEENPNAIQRIMTADLAADHVLKFTAHVRGTIVVSLQRLKNSAIVGLNTN